MKSSSYSENLPACHWLKQLLFPLLFLAMAGSGIAAKVGDVLNSRNDVASGAWKVAVGDDVDSVALEYRSSVRSPWVRAVSQTNPVGSREVALTIPKSVALSEKRVVVTKTRPIPAAMKFTKSAGNTAVTVSQAPSGKTMALEAFDTGLKSWKRVALAEAEKPGATVKINVPKETRSAELRVVAVDPVKPTTVSRKFPDIFRKGKTTFEGREVNDAIPTGTPPVMLAASSVSTADARTTTSNTVEEADIWRVLGKRIYFFNQLRGLQVIDATNAAAPEIVSSLRMPAVGEDMYVLSQNRVLLVRRDYSGDWKTFAVLIDCSTPTATVVGKAEVSGWYADSRIVNGRLVLATQSWNASTYGQTGLVSVIDDVATAPRVVATRDFQTGLSTMGAGPDYLWVAGSSWQNWGQSSLTLFRISDLPLLTSPISVTVQGNIQDKFKVHQNGNALFAITQSWASNWRGATKLETFTLTNGVATPAATLPLVEGESLHATRFDGDKAYAVTFRNVDPLWIIDISDATAPKIVSELQVTGWSSYIQPVGDCLAAVGVESGKVVASLFDVSDPANPALASRVEVGGDKQWTWSEANWNEKAVAILPDQNLILLPYQSWSWGNGADSAVQIIDLNVGAKSLTKRGVVKHAFQPRRATALEQGLLASISNRELLLVDASNRDKPAVLSDSTLAFRADRILFANEKFIVHCEDKGWESGNATLRVSDATDPENILAEAVLPGDRIAGGGAKGGRLAVATLNSNAPAQSSLVVYRFNDLPKLVETTRATADFSGVSLYGGKTELLWPTNDLAVVASTGCVWGWGRPIAFAGDVRIASCWIPGGWNSGGNVKFFPFDLSAPAAKACPVLDLSAKSYQNVSTLFAADGLIVFSAEKSEKQPLKKIVQPLLKLRFPIPVDLPRTVLNSYLTVVDFADPSAPALWPSVSIPGKLQSIADFDRSAGVIITSTPKPDSGETLTALLFESGVASSIASLDLTDGQPRAFSGRSVYMASASSITRRTLENNGTFALKGTLTNLPWNPGELFTDGKSLAFRNGLNVGLVDAALVSDISTWALDSWLWWNLSDARFIGDSMAIPLRDYGIELLK